MNHSPMGFKRALVVAVRDCLLFRALGDRAISTCRRCAMSDEAFVAGSAVGLSPNRPTSRGLIQLAFHFFAIELRCDAQIVATINMLTINALPCWRQV
jgi:hypothetical protein